MYQRKGRDETRTSSTVSRIGVTAGLDPSGILVPDRFSISSTASSMACLCVVGIDSKEGIRALNIDQYTHCRSSCLWIADHGAFLNLGGCKRADRFNV